MKNLKKSERPKGSEESNTTISADGAEGFFKRGRTIAKLADKGMPIPKKRIINFNTPEEMLAVLTKERRRLMLTLRKSDASISDLTRLTHRDRAAVAKDVKLLEHYGLVTVSEEINPGHGHHKIVRAISKYPIHLKATL
jgi:predicted transcriptional regulator